MNDGNLTYRITVTGLDTELQQIGELEQKLDELTQARKQQKQAIDMLSQAKGVDQKLIDQEKKRLGELNIEIKRAQEAKSRLTKTVQQAQKVHESDINTLAGMRLKISQLRASIEGKPIGSKEFLATSKQIADLQGKVNGLDADMKNWRGNVGNYSSAVQGLAGQFGFFSREMQMARQALQAVSGGLSAAAKSSGGLSGALRILKVALVSTGIGAIVVALGSLAAYFTRSEEGARKFKEIITPVIVTLENMADVAANAGKLLVSLFSFDAEKIASSWNTLKESVTGFYQETKREIKEAQAINKVQWAQDERLRRSQIQIAKNDLQIAKLKNIAAQRELVDSRERFQALEDAMRLEEANLDLQLKIARTDFEIKKRKAELAMNDKATNDELAESEANLFRVQAANFTRRKEMIGQQQEIMKKALTERTAANQIEAMNERTTEEAKVQMVQRGEATMTYIAEQEAQRRAMIRKQEVNAAVEAYAAIAGMGAQMFGEHTAAYQVLASAEAAMNTYLAANKAYADPLLPFPSNIIMAGVITAMGLRNVAAINKISFASGGRVPSGYELPHATAQGDNTLALVKPNEVILNEVQQARMGGAAAFKAAGVPGFAAGGIVPRSAPTITQPTMDVRAIARSFAAMVNEVPVVVTERNITTTQRRVAVRERMRTF